MQSRSQGLRLWRVSMRRGRNPVIRVRIIDLYHHFPPVFSMNLPGMQSLWHRLIPYGEAWLLQISGAPPRWLRRPQGPMCPPRLTSDHRREKTSYGIDNPVIVTSPWKQWDVMAVNLTRYGWPSEENHQRFGPWTHYQFFRVSIKESTN